MRRRRTQTRSRADVRPVWAACSALLDYPTAELVAAIDDIEALVPGNAPLAGLLGHLRVVPLGDLQAQYVATFDHTRKCALHLTYFAYGDTRRRGQALLRFKETYRSAGVVWDESTGELPDHLCAVLQLGATVDVATAAGLLADHRAGVEMLRLALTRWRNDDGTTGSPWAGALVAVCATLPDLRGDEADAVRRLIEQGPPAEEVGLDGYGAGPALIAPATLAVRS
ncbi:nitrate reductase molybdenum cofactor assembly chaperone [Pimelobacter sp. 30-1]|uniref:nitrate reductase molybdenum cofactor assembly chaperone n=1 Tax=Pimelobacter sp. 30-1 TaxID=2004991 RepID=UPI001C047480|nr:nitrate reductase molybdenum cofactor assembly chaperone [Pimelobacter sp. 30-1]MBU2695959.1 nitrate reductase molybdenum cofactor assembly chaperone [Pimelobacter sp. 30-1]